MQPTAMSAKHAILTCCDEASGWNAAFLMSQLRQRTDTRSCVYYVFTDRALSASTSAMIKRYATLIRCEDVFDLDEFAPDGPDGAPNPARESFLVLFALETLTRIHSKVLFVDKFSFALGDGFDALFSYPFTAPAAAVRHISSWTLAESDKIPAPFKDRMPAGCERALSPALLLVDAAQFSETGIGQAAIADLRSEGGTSFSALNVAFADRWQELAPRWNWPMTEQMAIIGAMRPLQLVNFLGGRKPWSDNIGFFDVKYLTEITAFLTYEEREQDLQMIRNNGFQPHRERRRLRFLEGWSSNLVQSYDQIKDYIDREDFIDGGFSPASKLDLTSDLAAEDDQTS